MKNEKRYDLIVVGCGAMGAAALYQASKRGLNVLGIDRYDPPHEMGSSHAETRFTRLAVGEGSQYAPLVARAHEIWRELEAISGEEIFYQNGLYIISPKEFEKEEYNHWENFVERSADIAAGFKVPYEVLTSAEVRQRHPKILIKDDEYAGFEPTGGHVMAERAVAVQLRLAREAGATIIPNQPVTQIESDEDGVTVTTADGVYHAGRAIVSAGAWIHDFVPQSLAPNFKVTRQVVFWFQVENPEEYGPDHLPGILWVGKKLEEYFACFMVPPGSRPGLKVLTEQYIDVSTPHEIAREVTEEEISFFFEHFGAGKIEGMQPNCLKASVCLYTHTPDDDFVIDWHPEFNEKVLVVSACSSHGFKHSAAIGEAMVQKVIDGKSEIPLNQFAWDRLAG